MLISATPDLVAILSSRKIHLISLKRTNLYEVTEIDISSDLPPSCKTPPEKINTQCIDISPDGNKMCVADTEKFIHVYFLDDHGWTQRYYIETEKKVKKLQFSPKLDQLIITDKLGDIYLCEMTDEKANKPKRILGHCSSILDTTIAPDNSRIFTCDRDEKIRCSMFPNAYNIDTFLLGHKEAVVNISIVSNGQRLLSSSADGSVRLWNLAEKKCIQTWEIFSLFPELKPPHCELPEVRIALASQVKGKIYTVMKIQGIDVIPVFEIYIRGLNDDILFRYAGKLRNETDAIDFVWQDSFLYMFTPELESVLKRYTVADVGIMPDTKFPDKLVLGSEEFKHLAKLTQPTFSLRKPAINNTPHLSFIPKRKMANLTRSEEDDNGMAAMEEEEEKEGNDNNQNQTLMGSDEGNGQQIQE